MTSRRHPTDLHILGAVVALGIKGAAAEYGISEMSVRHRLHRLYKERGIKPGRNEAKMAMAVWICREDLERIVGRIAA